MNTRQPATFAETRSTAVNPGLTILDARIAAIVRLLRSLRVDLSSEKAMQEGVEGSLRQHGVAFEREKRLSARDIPDFLIDGGIVVEFKLRGKSRKIDVYKQLVRYAQSDLVAAIILASNTNMGLPEQIGGKPVYAASLSLGWCT